MVSAIYETAPDCRQIRTALQGLNKMLDSGTDSKVHTDL
jgi:hypothetical protein